MSAADRPAPPRLALGPAEAAASLGLSRDTFDSQVLPDLKVIRIGRRILVGVAELERWIATNERGVLS